MRQKGTPDPGRILESKKCCGAQQLPNGFRSGVGIGGHSIGWATFATYRLFSCLLCAKSGHATPLQDDVNVPMSGSRNNRWRRWKSALEGPRPCELSTLWPTQSEITLGAEHIAVKACDPLPPPRGHIQVLNGEMYMRRNAAPKKLRV